MYFSEIWSIYRHSETLSSIERVEYKLRLGLLRSMSVKDTALYNTEIMIIIMKKSRNDLGHLWVVSVLTLGRTARRVVIGLNGRCVMTHCFSTIEAGENHNSAWFSRSRGHRRCTRVLTSPRSVRSIKRINANSVKFALTSRQDGCGAADVVLHAHLAHCQLRTHTYLS